MKKRRYKALTNIGIRREIAQAVLLSSIMNFMILAIILLLHIHYEVARAEEVKNMHVLFQKVEMVDSIQKGLLLQRKDDAADTEVKPAAAKVILTASDEEHITRICMAEAGADYEGCLAVAQCIYDRSILWNKSPIEVATAHHQFAKPRAGEIYPASLKAVEDVFKNGKRMFPETKVTHFFSGDEVPYWAHDKTYVGEVGGNKFYI